MQIEFWRRVIRNIEHTNDEGASHPYQVLLHLVARKLGISRAKCALALVAADDSAAERVNIAARLETFGRSRRDLHLRGRLSPDREQDRYHRSGSRRAAAQERQRADPGLRRARTGTD